MTTFTRRTLVKGGTALAAAGPLNPVEYADVRTTAEKLGPAARASGGGVFWVGAPKGLNKYRQYSLLSRDDD